MPKYIPISLFALCCIQQVYAQNLVTNPGFELKYQCPTDRSEIYVLPLYKDFPTVLDWVSAVNTSPDYFNTCGTNVDVKLPYLSLDGYHQPRTGDACAGIAVISCHLYSDTTDYWSEYMETRLSSPLEAGHTYYICYYVCLAYHSRQDFNIISVDNIGARLTTQMIDTTCKGPMYYVNGPPDISSPPGLFITDTANWTLISGTYKATGGEQWLTIGRFYASPVNFKLLYSPENNISTMKALADVHSVCYMLVDDVCTIDMSDPIATDTDIYTPQFPISIGLGKPEGQFQYLWDNGDTSLLTQVSQPGSYVRQKWGDCAYTVDTFTVKEATFDYCIWLPDAFTPNNDGLNDLFGPGNNYCQPVFANYSFNIYNRWGQLVFQTADPAIKWDGKYNGVPQEIGVYFYTLTYTYSNTNPSTAAIAAAKPAPTFIKGDVTLIR